MLPGACQHPEALRRPIPGYESDDPNEWECVGCGTWQVREGGLPGLKREIKGDWIEPELCSEWFGGAYAHDYCRRPKGHDGRHSSVAVAEDRR